MAEPSHTMSSDSETTVEEKSRFYFPDIALGIDIGTSHCRAALWNGSHVKLLFNIENQKLMPSCDTFHDGKGSGGMGYQLSHEHEMLPGATIFDTNPDVHVSKSFRFLVQKLDIGVRPSIEDLVNCARRTVSASNALWTLLVELKVKAETQIMQPIRNVVLSIPVSLSRMQITRIEQTCISAGLYVTGLIPEPMAVALLYAQHQQKHLIHDIMSNRNEKIALIFNMGAGYCDVAVATSQGGVLQMKASAGSSTGGEDLLRNMMNHLLQNYGELNSNHKINEIKSIELLRVATQDAIHKLSFEESVQIEVDLGSGVSIFQKVAREKFEEVNQKIFEKCESLIIRCLHDAKVEVDDLNDVLVVGGCSYIPKIRNLVKSICRKEIYGGVNPFEAAVTGAALEGALTLGIRSFRVLGFRSIRVTTHRIGIRANGNSFVPFIPRNAEIPALKLLDFTTIHDNQSEVLIVFYEGEANQADDNHLLGYLKISGLPPAPKGFLKLTVCLNLDESNFLRAYVSASMDGYHKSTIPIGLPNVYETHEMYSEEVDTCGVRLVE